MTSIEANHPLPTNEWRDDARLAAHLDRSASYVAQVRAEIRRKTPIIAGPRGYEHLPPVIDRSTAQPAPEE